jgi:hypothetical protein
MAKQKAVKAKKPKPVVKSNHLLVPFPAEHLPPAEVQEVPEAVEASPERFTAECEIESLGTHFLSGTVFVALRSADDRNLLELLRKGQRVTLQYGKED